MAEQRTTVKPAFDAAHGDPDKTRFPALAGLVADSSKKGHVLLGEPHEDGMAMRTYAFLAASPEMFKQAAQNGVKHLVLEFPHEFQGKIDSYLEGKTDRPELRYGLFKDPDMSFDSIWASNDGQREAFENSFLQTIDNARNAGMKVVAADVTVEEILKAQSGALEKLREGNLSQENHRKAISTIKSASWDRFDDAEQFNLLRQTIPPTDKIMAVVGVRHINSPVIRLDESDPRHGENPKGIADRLREEGGHPVTTIGLWNNDEQEHLLSNGPPEKMGFITEVRGTDFSAFFDTGETLENVIKTQSPAPSVKPERDFDGPGFGG